MKLLKKWLVKIEEGYFYNITSSRATSETFESTIKQKAKFKMLQDQGKKKEEGKLKVESYRTSRHQNSWIISME